jgi:hypothetical protein
MPEIFINRFKREGLDDSYEVNEADVLGLVKYNGKWSGIRLIVK